jgi:hypothetical protein
MNHPFSAEFFYCFCRILTRQAGCPHQTARGEGLAELQCSKTMNQVGKVQTEATERRRQHSASRILGSDREPPGEQNAAQAEYDRSASLGMTCQPRLRSQSYPLLSISTKSGLSRVLMGVHVLVR